MHYQTSYSTMPYSGGSLMVDNSAPAWSVLAPTVGGSPIVPSSSQLPNYPGSGCAPFAPQPLYQLAPIPAVTTQASDIMSTGVPYYQGESSPSAVSCYSPAPSSASFGDSVTGQSSVDSPLPSSSSSAFGLGMDASLRHMVEQRSAMVANLPGNVSSEARASADEQIKPVQPLLRKPIDMSKMNERQMQRLFKRRERNKQAAEKCRIKRREKSTQSRQEMAVLTRSNDELEQEVVQLRSELQHLQRMVCSHQCQAGQSKEELAEMVQRMSN